MDILLASGTYTIGSTEVDLMTGAAFAALHANKGYVSAMVDCTAMGGGDTYRLRAYQAAYAGQTPQFVDSIILAGTKTAAQIMPSDFGRYPMLSGGGWWLSIQKTAGTDRAMPISVYIDVVPASVADQGAETAIPVPAALAAAQVTAPRQDHAALAAARVCSQFRGGG